MNIDFTEQQLKCIKGASNLFKAGQDIVTIAGAAGTGKSTIVGSIVREMGLKSIEVEYVTFTGKAALVLKRKGLPGRTIHSLIYNYIKDDYGNHTFELKKVLDNPYCRLIVIDEISMVGESLLKDIQSFGIKLLCLGDPFQLEPVLDEPTNLLKNADFLLTEIHRQAADNPIIKFSFEIRNKETLQYKEEDNDNIRVIPVDNLSMPVLIWADQILCSTHRIRESLNRQIREYKGFTKEIPELGDKIICLKNYKTETSENSPEHLVNGMVGYVTQIYYTSFTPHREFMDIEFRPDYDQNVRFKTRIDLGPFLGKAPFKNGNPYRGKGQKIPMRCHFDFAYAITVHKSQGSEWDKVVVYSNDYWGERYKLAYTAVTRAKEKLVYIQ